MECKRQTTNDLYRQRFGVFSYLGNFPLAQDTRKRPQGTTQTAQRGLYTANLRLGKGPDAYFSPPQFHTVGDMYTEVLPPQLKDHDSAAKARELHRGSWKAGPKGTYGLFSAFPHGSEPPQQGRPLSSGPKNFYTKSGNSGTLGKYPEYMSDPYERKADLLKQHRKRQRDKCLKGAFKTTVYGSKNFGGLRDTFGCDREFTEKTRPVTYAGIRHERPFLPTNEAKHFGKHPQHAADPVPSDPKRPREGQWKYTHLYRTVPCPPVLAFANNTVAESSFGRFVNKQL